MVERPDDHSRRTFLTRLGGYSLALSAPGALTLGGMPAGLPAAGEYDLSWIRQLEGASDRAVVDAPGLGDFPLQLATRFLDNCDAAYGKGQHAARVVLNIRTRAIPIALTDEAWVRYSLGAEYEVKDRTTGTAVVNRNPFLEVPADRNG
ncbi:MAG: hypothetical protein U9Q74_05430 [Gemmatimonadota bacterium]|nr:hypothetical protein [Gemmatimonadota bacterium]